MQPQYYTPMNLFQNAKYTITGAMDIELQQFSLNVLGMLKSYFLQ